MKVYTCRSYGEHNPKVIFLLAGWGSSQWMLWPVSKLLQITGYHCITITYPLNILTPHAEQTVRNIETVKRYVMRTIRKLKRQNKLSFSIFGTSLGALIGLLVANQSPLVEKLILNTPGLDLAESLWSWDEIQPEFKQQLIQRYTTLTNFKRVIQKINPPNNLDNLVTKKMLIYISSKDKVALCPLDKLTHELEQRRCSYELVVNHSLGHIGTGIINLLNAPLYLDFLKR